MKTDQNSDSAASAENKSISSEPQVDAATISKEDESVQNKVSPEVISLCSYYILNDKFSSLIFIRLIL